MATRIVNQYHVFDARRLKQLYNKSTSQIKRIPRKTLTALQRYSWPGNVRELRNVIEHALIVTKGESLQIQLPDESSVSTQADFLLENIERRHILKVLEHTEWRVRGKQGAAELLGLKPTTLESRMKKLGIARPGSSDIS